MYINLLKHSLDIQVQAVYIFLTLMISLLHELKQKDKDHKTSVDNIMSFGHAVIYIQ